MPLPLPLSLSELQSAVATFGTPLQLYDERGIRNNARAFLRTMNAHFPGFKQFYAVKALPNPAILEILLQVWRLREFSQLIPILRGGTQYHVIHNCNAGRLWSRLQFRG